MNQSVNRPSVSVERAGNPHRVAAYRLDLRSDWGYLTAAVLSFLTFILLFQPWISASGPNGSIGATAFGQLDGITGGINSLQQNTFQDVTISGTWAMLAAVAALATVAAVVMYLRVRSEAFSRAMICSSGALALFVVIDMIYLNGKVPEIRNLTVSNNLVSGIGGIIRLLVGAGGNAYGANQAYSAGLTMTAMFGCAAAFGAVLCATSTGLRKFPLTASRLLRPTPMVGAAAQPADSPVAPRPVTLATPVEPEAPSSNNSDLLWERLLADRESAKHHDEQTLAVIRF